MNTPNPKLDLLADAYAILAGIPDQAIDLNHIVKKKTRRLECGTIACGIGWLALHPTFKKLGLSYNANCGLMYKRRWAMIGGVASQLFDITWDEGVDLFKGAGSSVPKHLHKNILLNRIKRLLLQKGYPVQNPKMLPVR